VDNLPVRAILQRTVLFDANRAMLYISNVNKNYKHLYSRLTRKVICPCGTTAAVKTRGCSL
jgi:hypothetical protein